MDLQTRPPSIRSVASNSSLNSATSLSRRPRTRPRSRSRSRTVTGASNRPDLPPPSPNLPSALPYLFPETPEPSNAPKDVPQRPPRSPNRLEPPDHHSGTGITSTGSTDTVSSVTDSAPADDPTVVESMPSSTPTRQPKAAKVASGLAPLDTHRQPLDAFQRDPALTPTVNIRDSVSTQQSGASSSIYPPSTPTASGPLSPVSTAGHFESIHDAFSPEPYVEEVPEYDNDDVSYRLRLLVKNNYFLPPAHSKPQPEDFAPPYLNAAKKPVTPTFLDIFRVGKAKSKPSTPTGPTSGFDPTAPMLRTTSDSITASYALRVPQPRVSSQTPRSPLPNPPPRGRVVVVREKMNDIASAAKQAEHDLKTRAGRNEQGSLKAKPEAIDDVIDPTDAVDVPLPAPGYPFAVQASALHGLGVLESVGADVLADRLPPNMSVAYDPAEDRWRKALLHEAVGHSLDNSADMSSFSHAMGGTSSPRSQLVETPVSKPTTPAVLQQRIITQPMIDVIDSTPDTNAKHKRQKSGASSKASMKGAEKKSKLTLRPAHEASRPNSFFPHRVETPTAMTPLQPPPRRVFAHAQHSLSQTDLTSHENHYSSPHSSSDTDARPSLRRTVSTPQLAEGYDSSYSRHGHDLMIPPIPAFRHSQQTTMTSTTVDTPPSRGSYKTAVGGSNAPSVHESDIGEPEALPRPSMASTFHSRPSISEYSQDSMSPTTSVFQDMLNYDHSRSASSSNPGPSRPSVETQNRMMSPTMRFSAMSPPPRQSSSLAHAALPPPPRTSSLAYQMGKAGFSRVHAQAPLSVSTIASDSDRTQPAPMSEEQDEEPTFSIVAPPPATPPLPGESSPFLLQRPNPNSHPTARPHSNPRSPVTLAQLDTTNLISVPPAIHSAGPHSSVDFFDNIESQHSAMDDLDSDEDESDEDDEGSGQQPEMPPLAHPPLHPHPQPHGAPQHGETASIHSPPTSFPGPLDSRVRTGSSASAGTGTSRFPLMKNGNFSSPYLRPAASYSHSALPISSSGIHSSGVHAKGIGNVPVPRSPSRGDSLPKTSYDFFTYAQEHPPPSSASFINMLDSPPGAGSSSFAHNHAHGPGSSSGHHGSGPSSHSPHQKRPATADHVASWRKDQKSQDSLRRLDGLLIRHMEDEKEAIRRIASTLKASAQT